MGFFTAPRITWGPGALEQLSALDAHRVVVVADPEVARGPRFRRVTEELEKTGSAVSVTPILGGEPTVASVEPVASALRERGPDWLVAVGGGSTIDTARAAWVRWVQPNADLYRLTPLAELGLRGRARFVAIPTTAGSGAEASWQAHLWDEEGALVEIASREIIPDWAILDPEFLRTLPPPTVADGAADLLAHAAEAVQSEWANPFSNAMAKEALQLVVANFPQLARRPEDETWERAQYAATLAGVASSNASAGNAHALAHALHGPTGLAHGRLVGIALPYVVDFNFPSARDALLTIGGILGPSSHAHRSSAAGRFRELLAPFGIPESLREAGVDPERVLGAMGRIVERAMRSSAARANPRVASREEWEVLVRRVTLGAAEVDQNNAAGLPHR